jgi:hypothetical protein
MDRDREARFTRSFVTLGERMPETGFGLGIEARDNRRTSDSPGTAR